ncbi:hypothetical protein [Meiothermus granaticius]|uniref:Uncharacterized protein n=1 Tax=Meiothermus granaticius NBRC 107808 TaxID=1227551 RepID=A0A399F8F0_9DEIN|nr:hypothetical protein [Meiothermus granaticius]RIH91172.1 hypothetical protein Mgrana_02956 [Meiothermus granaticius NBRC 107808]GEM88372.1 hypothetical protein MGR01S_29970 [Meiothermus granaticius NBRC 107808]
METRHRIPKFKNLDEEMDFYANIDKHIPMQELNPQEEAELDKLLGIRRREKSLPKTKTTRKAS